MELTTFGLPTINIPPLCGFPDFVGHRISLFGQQRLNHILSLFVSSFADMQPANAALLVDDKNRGPGPHDPDMVIEQRLTRAGRGCFARLLPQAVLYLPTFARVKAS